MIDFIAESIYSDDIEVEAFNFIERSVILDLNIESVSIMLRCVQETLKQENRVAIIKISLGPDIKTIQEEDSFELSLNKKVISRGKIIKITRR